jgi:hypothetical protein
VAAHLGFGEVLTSCRATVVSPSGGAGTTDAQQDAVLEQVLGLDSHQLARRAAHRILRIYG